jgi:glycosyltransferase involved in cell wall biosynthesis
MKKLLVFSTTFFPDPVVAAIRITAWAKHLPDYGWKPIIVCGHYGHESSRNELTKFVNAHVEIHYLGPKREISSHKDSLTAQSKWNLKSVARSILDLVSVPDLLIWKQRSNLRDALTIANRVQPDAVLSTSPLHSVHWLGEQVAQAIDRPWIADFRDPYIIDGRFFPSSAGPVVNWMHKRFEQRIYRRAEVCVHAIPIHARWAKAKYSFARNKIKKLTNGIPDNLLDSLKSQVPKVESTAAADETRVLSMASLPPFLINRFAAALSRIDAKFRVIVCGTKPQAVDLIVEGSNFQFDFVGRLAHEEVLNELKSADILVGYLSPNRSLGLGLSSKLFEYLATGKPVININSTRSDRIFLRRYKWCQLLEQPSEDELSNAVERANSCKELPNTTWLDSFRTEHSRSYQCHQLSEWLDKAVDS